jgi:prolyl oligopeptidase
MRRGLLLTLVPTLLAAVGEAATPAKPAAPPAAARRPVTDRYFDVEILDDYRWLENASDPEVRAWSDAENAWARSILDNLPSVAEIRDRVRAITGFRSPAYSKLMWKRGLFALKSEPPKQQALLVTLDSPLPTRIERVVVDPNALDPNGGTSIDWLVPSGDGKLVAVSLSQGGSETGTLRVYETATGRALPDVIPRVNGGTAGGDVAWTGDGTGFFYTRYPREGERPASELEFFQQVYFHRLGTPGDADVYELGKELPRIAEITLEASDDGRFVLATVKNGDGGDASLYLRSPDGAWKRIAADADRVVRGRFASDGSLYLLSYKAAPRGAILRLAPGATDLAAAAAVVPESEAAIDDYCVTGTRLYVADLVGGPSQIRVFVRDQQAVREAGTLPILPISSVGGMIPGKDGILFENQSALEPPAWYYSEGGPVGQTALVRRSPVDFSDCEIVREWAVSKDGTRVPIDVLRKTGTKLDGTNPTLLYGYGGYGISQRPSYSALRRVWIEQGGVFAVAVLRGGGEFGDGWHRAGHLTRKQNVFDDFAACAKRLIDAGYTKPQKLAIEGGSNGGLLMGAAFTQHPELFGAVVAHVGIYDMLRVELSPNGQFNITEFGTVKNPDEFRALRAYSPYHRVLDRVAYPPVLLLTGANDPRVDPMQSRKMAARLRAGGARKADVLLRTSASSGHGIGSSLDQKTAEAVDVYAFLFDRLAVKYRPVPGVDSRPRPRS